MWTFAATHTDKEVNVILSCNDFREYEALMAWFKARGYRVSRVQ